MSEPTKPEEQIKEAAWKFTGTAIMVVAFFLAGVGIAYTQWGDAPQLREELETIEGRLSGARTERENMQHTVNRLNRQLEAAQAELASAKAAAEACANQADAEAPAE